MIWVTVLLAAVALAALAFAWRSLAQSGKEAPEFAAMRADFDRLRQVAEQSVQSVAQLQGNQAAVQNSLNEVTRAIAETQRSVAQQVQSSSGDVVRHLSNVQQTFAGLQSKVGEMTGHARQLTELSRSIADLQNILSAPKLRGGFGETQLENLLSNVFAREQFAVQFRFPSGEVADAVLFFPQGNVAIDSKFPLENFRRIGAAESDSEKKSLRREFLKDVRKRIDEIASKYIVPNAGTLPFALMYIPAENVYYEAVIREDEENTLYDYCVRKRVVPVSPNTLYAYLQTIVLGLNSLRVSQRAELILQEIAGLDSELAKFGEVYGKLGTHLKNAYRSYEDSLRELGKVEARIQALGQSAPGQLPLQAEPQRSAARAPE